ncbi:hypothetical protein B0H21DRAFT_150907 [Amylocystis lapponica]|nr:hypothetical protein B0H21DRAFT_150907 [Amylocystis lapponica]
MSANHNSRVPADLRRMQSRSSTVLWGHLLNGGSASDMTSHTPSTASISPITPLDKAGTTMRILLHDTQANLERFSDRVITLTGGIDATKREITTIHKLFEQDREKLVEDTVDLVNRCQAEIQRSLGRPAQAPELDKLRADFLVVDRKFEALDKKIDVLHMLNQTQSQALQTLLDQQGKMLHALAPILPLLQAVPLHIENARNHIKEAVLDVQRCSGISSSSASTSRNTTLWTDPSFSPPQDEAMQSKKRRRLDSEAPNLRVQDSIGHVMRNSSARGSDVPSNHPRQYPVVSLPASDRREAVTPSSHNAFQTPRRMPLSDLLCDNSIRASPLSIGNVLKPITAAASAEPLLKIPVRPSLSISRPAVSDSSVSLVSPVRTGASSAAKSTHTISHRQAVVISPITPNLPARHVASTEIRPCTPAAQSVSPSRNPVLSVASRAPLAGLFRRRPQCVPRAYTTRRSSFLLRIARLARCGRDSILALFDVSNSAGA